MSDISANFPQEIISDILIRLPAKSVGRSRCVSKPWLSLLTSYEFIKAHLAYHTHLAQEQKYLLLSYTHSLFSLALNPGGCLSRKLESFDEEVVTLAGSCNGLVLVVTEGNVKCLINCMTEEYAKLPDSPLALDPSASFSMHGFGYDSLSDDYKIVSLSHARTARIDNARTDPVDNYDTNNEHEPDCADTFVDIYSLKMRSWRRFGASPYDHCVPELASGVFVNGALHWLGWKSSDNSSVIAAFDLSSEKFQEIPAPASLDRDRFVFGKLQVLDGCLGILLEQYNSQVVEIWFMKSYSLVESWTKIVIEWEIPYWLPLCLHKDKLLVLEKDEIFKWYYLEDGRTEAWMVNDDKHEFKDEITYSETLVSPPSLQLS